MTRKIPDKIEAACVDLFIEGGPSAITHRALCLKMGWSSSSTAAHYGTVAELREIAVDKILRSRDTDHGRLRFEDPWMLEAFAYRERHQTREQQ